MRRAPSRIRYAYTEDSPTANGGQGLTGDVGVLEFGRPSSPPAGLPGPERWSVSYIGMPHPFFATGRLARPGALVGQLHRHAPTPSSPPAGLPGPERWSISYIGMPPPLLRHRPACLARSAGRSATHCMHGILAERARVVVVFPKLDLSEFPCGVVLEAQCNLLGAVREIAAHRNMYVVGHDR
jgi:hypothetical protein